MTKSVESLDAEGNGPGVPGVTRRQFCLTTAGVLTASGLATHQVPARTPNGTPGPATQAPDVRALDRARVLRAADAYLQLAPVTITAFTSDRSAGGRHDYFSEGDYWWPDPEHPDRPYIQKDGLTNPNNFVAHRHALIELSLRMPALTAAWVLTRDTRYARHAAAHLRAWFLDPNTLMNPNLQYAQAIHGRATGRGIGIIDTLHLVEVSRAAGFLRSSGALSAGELAGIERWFSEYLRWMTTSDHGIEEREAKNNHGTCWVMQVAQFASFTRNQDLLEFCRDRFKTVLVPNQIAADGSLPLEIKRTKPYSYCLFNLDALASTCQILSAHGESLWTYELPDGRGLRRAVAFMFPFIRDKQRWPYPPDVQYFDQFPVRQPSLLFAGLAYSQPEYLELWGQLNPDPTVEEVIRNYPVRQPVLWV